MDNIKFAVSAKTARLIGRENISGVDSAVLELIKNSYDADATCSFILFDMPFPSVPKTISFELAETVFMENDYSSLLTYYEKHEEEYVKKDIISVDDEGLLSSFLFAFNRIIIVDNGEGMTENILRTTWMNIGTSDKDENRISRKGRVKTGAKGIGRFALDKLSVQTTVITHSKEDKLLKWHIDWNQFEEASLLDDISASIDSIDNDTFFNYTSRIIKDKLKTFDQYEWETGTAIILEPIREPWSKDLFVKLNSNLRSLFAEETKTPFDVYVNNKFFPEYSFVNERFKLERGQYDYKIVGQFDGKDSISISITRNEVDVKKRVVSFGAYGKVHTEQLSEFWSRERFQKKDYHRSDYAKTINSIISANEVTQIDKSVLSSIGPFEVELYFLKNTNSTIGIIKRFNANDRKEILKKYSGVKIYRDGFKVRPYGENGPAFDWLGLSERVTKSPGAVGGNGAWRVRTNQLFGYVRISKDNNPSLVDMANREGLKLNETYFGFVELIRVVIESFEGDRQIFFREYSAWTKHKIDQYSNTENIIANAKENSKKASNELPREKGRQKDNTNFVSDDDSSNHYSVKDYESAILELQDEQISKERAMKTMMLYSSAGIMTSTFSHEINRILTNVGSRAQHLRYTINRLIGEEGYKGNPLFDPFPIINQAEVVDKIQEKWLDVIINGVGTNSFERKKNNFYQSVKSITELWKPLLELNLIEINTLPLKCDETDVSVVCADADIYIILNNFILNSVWFLNKCQHEKNIQFLVDNSKGKIVLMMENNGPVLDKMFSNNPDRIFNPGESSKEKKDGEGTGLGLWIMKTIVEDLSGTIEIIEKEEGFGLKVSLPK